MAKAGRLLKPPLEIRQIGDWARADYARHGRLPSEDSGPVTGQPGLTWKAVNVALRNGYRGLPGGTSLGRLLSRHFPEERLRSSPLPLSKSLILKWADAHKARTGRWPKNESGPIWGAPGQTWVAVGGALRQGGRGLPGGDSLARFLHRHRQAAFRRMNRSKLTIEQILRWSDEYHRRTGRWPSSERGPIAGAAGENWNAVRCALRFGVRGLPGGTSLARLLEKRRGVPYPIGSVGGRILTKQKIMAWAREHYSRTGVWPSADSGPIRGQKHETWRTVAAALKGGFRGLPGGESLAQFLGRRPGNIRNLIRPRLTERQILKWADTHHARTGRWPTQKSKEIIGAPGETWGAIRAALWGGHRGLKRGTNLGLLLARYRNADVELHNTSKLTIGQILSWADAHHRRTGSWPIAGSGTIHEEPSESWQAVTSALVTGGRGLPGGTSLSRLLAERRGAPRPEHRTSRLSTDRILAWADAHRLRTGQWPDARSGPIRDVPGETWQNVAAALRSGSRGLPKGSSLTRLLARRRGLRNAKNLPDLSLERVLKWADAHHRRTGKWPSRLNRDPIPEAPGETWLSVDHATSHARRGLTPAMSLAALLTRHRGARLMRHIPKLTERQILAWAVAHHRRTGKWPTSKKRVPIDDAPGETWSGVHAALRAGVRGLPGGSTLSQLLAGLKARTEAASGGPPLSAEAILLWARAHHRRHGAWPDAYSGRIPDAPGETWLKVDKALRDGRRGLRGRQSLTALLSGRSAPHPL